jgi:DNA-binding SARP family transcriptional activator/tetratricopeptide (TPR) repeat protein
VEFVILGPTALYLNGQAVPLGAAQQRAMLAVLLYHVGDPVRVDSLVEYIWSGDVQDPHRQRLYALASRIRHVLDTVGVRKSLIRLRHPPAYRLEIDPMQIDYHRFRKIVREARTAAEQGHHDISTSLLITAIDLWRNEPLADLRGVQGELLRLRASHSLYEARQLLVDSKLKMGQHQWVLDWLEPLVQVSNDDEALAQLWINALCVAGRENDARAFFVAFRRRFREQTKTQPEVHLPRDLKEANTHSLLKLSTWRKTSETGPGPRQLPKDVIDFTGHQQVLTEIDDLTESENGGAAVLITGMPGVGKTTLASHWGHRRRHRFPDGQLYLNMNAYGSTEPIGAEEALGRLLRSLGIPADRIPNEPDQRQERYNQLISSRRLLIFIDNVGNSNHVRPLIPSSSLSVTLITSRTRLTGLTVHEGIRCITLLPLPNSQAHDLLVEIVGRRRAAEEPEALKTLAQLSGGLPLALRIIGEQVAQRPRTTVAELLEQLKGRLLRTHGDDNEASSLQTVFAWSYNALRPSEARLFRIAGLYPGSNLSSNAVGAMLGIDRQQAETELDALARMHLVNHDVAGRYRFHDLLRAYAVDRALEEESSDARVIIMNRLLNWYLLSAANAATVLAPNRAPVPDLPSSSEIEPEVFESDTEAMRWCEAERNNFEAIVRWAAAHQFHRHAWQIPAAVHDIFDRYGRQDDVASLNELALSVANIDDHPIGHVGTLNNLGYTYLAMHRYRDAAAAFENGMRLAGVIGNIGLESVCRHNLASALLATGSTEEARTLYEQVLETCRVKSDKVGEASALHRLGDVSRRLTEFPKAIAYYSQSLEIRHSIGALRAEGTVHGDLARTYLELNQTRLALDHCLQALEIHDRTRDEAATCDALTTLADAQRHLHAYKEACKNATRAAEVSHGIGDSLRRCRALSALADAQAASGEMAAARRTASGALLILDEIDAVDVDSLRDRLRRIDETVH